MLKEFREFIMRGNVLDLAVGIIIGAAFGGIVKSLVDDVIMPPIGLALGQVDFKQLYVLLKEGATPAPYPSMAAAKGLITFSLIIRSADGTRRRTRWRSVSVGAVR